MFQLFKQAPSASFPPIVFQNTLSQKKESFTPLSKKSVTLYSCGPTVYDYVHVGNLRSFILADTVKRALIYNGYDVNHTMNYTDFGQLTSDADTGEDKMMKGMRRDGYDITLKNMLTFAETYITAFERDRDALNIIPPTQSVRASDYVKEQIKLIETLAEKGYTYQTSDGLYFDVSTYQEYGKLGSLTLDGDKQARIDANTEKRHPADFALWKNSDLGWESKWGQGFPGWHIECSAMAFATLGKQIDIHTGGIDLSTIHHNAEIAQCECATGKKFAQVWLHNEFLNVNSAKISKSAGNGLTLGELMEHGYHPDEYRYWLLQSHYRTTTDFSYEALTASQHALRRIKQLMFKDWRDARGKLDTDKQSEIVAAINDDLNTPKVIAIMHDIIKSSTYTAGEKRTLLLEIDALLGIGLSDDPEDGLADLGHMALTSLPEDVQALIDERQAARIAQNWPEADRLRDAIKTKGYDIKDGPEGPVVTTV